MLGSVLSHPSKDMDLKGAAMAVLISVLWGANTVVIKMGLEDAPPLRLACMRLVVGGVVICLWAWATGRFVGFRVEPAEWRPLVLLGLLFSIQMAATHVGTWLTSAAHAQEAHGCPRRLLGDRPARRAPDRARLADSAGRCGRDDRRRLARRADDLSGARGSATGPGEAPPDSGHRRHRGLHRGLRSRRARADPLDDAARRPDRPPARAGRRIQPRGEPGPAAPLSAERALGVLPHPADLRRDRRGPGRR